MMSTRSLFVFSLALTTRRSTFKVSHQTDRFCVFFSQKLFSHRSPNRSEKETE